MRGGAVTLVRAGLPQAAARVNWGRMIADCPRCPGAAAAVGAVLQCRSCGQQAEIVYPPEEMLHAIERLLMMRPDPTTRNWSPGETLHDLVLENAVHGILADPESESGLVIAVDDNGIREDRAALLYGPTLAVSA